MILESKVYCAGQSFYRRVHNMYNEIDDVVNNVQCKQDNMDRDNDDKIATDLILLLLTKHQHICNLHKSRTKVVSHL